MLKRFLLVIVMITLTIVLGGSTLQQRDECVAYYGAERFCVPGNITLKTWFTPAPEYMEGNAVWYSPQLMEATARYRGLDLKGYLDGVSLMSPADIGKTVWIHHPDLGWEGPYLVVDCAQQNHMYGVIVSRDEVVEVGYTTAVRWGMVNNYRVYEYRIEGVEVYVGETLPYYIEHASRWSWKFDIDISPVSYRQQFLDTLTFTSIDEGRPIMVSSTTWKMPDGTIFENLK